jgi:hypothetical protein
MHQLARVQFEDAAATPRDLPVMRHEHERRAGRLVLPRFISNLMLLPFPNILERDLTIPAENFSPTSQ